VRLRTAKVLLVAGLAIFHTLLVFDNSTDYGSNYQFVRHVLMMDSTFPENHGSGARSIARRCTPCSICRSSPGRRRRWCCAIGER
jgi:predicted small integral membrane protein